MVHLFALKVAVMKVLLSLLTMLFLVVGTVISSFASAINEGESKWVTGESYHTFKAYDAEKTNIAGKSNGDGINIGMDFIFGDNTPLPPGQNAVAAFILGVDDLVICNGPSNLNNTIRSCNFVFSYSIGGVSQLDLPNSGSYIEWGGSCVDPGSPLTLQDCINDNSFGQIFKPTVSGLLTELTMDLTFLNESGGAIDNLEFFLYEINVGDVKLGNLLQSVTVDLDGVPFLTDWTNHQFTVDDFHTITMPFDNINLVSGTYYGVFPGGDYVPGDLPGEDDDDPVAVPLSDYVLILVIFFIAGTLILISRKTILRF